MFRLPGKLIELIAKVPDIAVRYRIAHALFWKFNVWEGCKVSSQVNKNKFLSIKWTDRGFSSF